jgi:hypothetical protein
MTVWRVCDRCKAVCGWGVTTFRSRKGWTVNLCDDCLEELEELGIDLFGELERACKRKCACRKTEG